VIAAEALIRWIHPEFGMIPPDHFIALMEKTGFIIHLGEFIVDEVFKQLMNWHKFGFRSIQVSINVSMVEIATGEYVKYVIKKFEEYKIDPASVKFEITEGMAMIGETQTKRYFKELKSLGAGISLDDFGTGYTSFGYLKKFPADVLKIDKSLVDYVLESVEDQRIVHGIIDLGHTLGMKIVVEGIENKEMVAMLRDFGCDYMQGYHFSKPLPSLEFQKFIRQVS
jgi:EAL domain-containing protein (putative c-di-GMP-specific phosphodiesterase class I)